MSNRKSLIKATDRTEFKAANTIAKRKREDDKASKYITRHEFIFGLYGSGGRCSLNRFKAYWLRETPTGLTFNNCTLCPHCIYVFCIYLRTNSDLCHLQHKLIGFFITKKKSAYCAVRTGSLNKVVCASSLKG